MSSHKPECNAKWEFDHDHCICKWIEQAEQRIIELLEESLVVYRSALGEKNNFVAGYGSAIEHIKGEQK